jgi:hypothetical protein
MCCDCLVALGDCETPYLEPDVINVTSQQFGAGVVNAVNEFEHRFGVVLLRAVDLRPVDDRWCRSDCADSFTGH